MQKNLLTTIFFLLVVGNIFSQSNSPYDDIVKIAERENELCPIDSQGTKLTRVYLEEIYYTVVGEVENIKTFRVLRDRKKAIKKGMISQLKVINDSDFMDLANLLIICNMEIRYIYVYKPKGWETDIILTKKDLKKILKH